MWETILVTSIVGLLTLLHISTTGLMMYMIKRDFEPEGFKARWKSLNKKEKIISYILIGFPIIIYLFVTYLLIDIWINFLTLI